MTGPEAPKQDERTELRLRWITALESGKYRQGTGVLKRPGGSYCCLGLACEVIGQGQWHSGLDCETYGSPDGQASWARLPSSLQEQLGLEDAQGEMLALEVGAEAGRDLLAQHVLLLVVGFLYCCQHL